MSSTLPFPGSPGLSLFTRSALTTPEKTRPLGPLSDFVVEALPGLLGEIRRGERRPDQLFGDTAALEHAPRFEDVAEADRPIACLDLMLLQHACDRVGAAPPRELGGLAEALCRSLGRIDAFLYEDCVLANPLTRDPRVFTGGEVGLAERDFLLVHTLIEACLGDVVRRARDILERIEERDGRDGAAPARAVAEHASPILSGLGRLRALFLHMRAMRREDFQGFRDHYLPSPRTGHPGPSGRFSAKFFLLRVLVEGSAIGLHVPSFYVEVLELFRYFPRGDREMLLGHVLPEYVSGKPLSEGARRIFEAFGSRRRPRVPSLREASLEPWARSTGLPELLASLREALDACTSIHLGLVQKNIVDRTAETAVASPPVAAVEHGP